MQPNQARRALPVLSSSFSALLLAFLPKCPFCLVMLLAPLGIRVPGSSWFLIYAVVMLAVIPVAFFWSPPCRRCGIGPLAAGLGGLLIMIIGRFAGPDLSGSSIALMATGAMLMLAAAVWTARLSRSTAIRHDGRF
jgi:hypothetical protein